MTTLANKNFLTTFYIFKAHSRKLIVFICGMIFCLVSVHAQNVGIGTSNPTKKLSVNGSVVVDHDSTNQGTLDSASLLFGGSGKTGISSNKVPGANNYGGIDFWTNGAKRLTLLQNGNLGINQPNPLYRLQVGGNVNSSETISAGINLIANSSIFVGGSPYNSGYRLHVRNGNSLFEGNGTFIGNNQVGGNLTVDGSIYGASIRSYSNIRADEHLAVGGATDNNYRLRIYDGNARVGGDFHATGNAAIGGEVDNNYRLRVYGGNARIGGDVHATGNAAVGGAVDDNYRLRVYDGNSRFGGDVQVTGTLNTAELEVADNFTIKGTGSVRSEGPSPLKIGFKDINENLYINYGPHEHNFYIISLPDFDNISDVRVLFSHYIPNGNSPWAHSHRFRFRIKEINPVSNTATLWIFNDSDDNSFFRGTIGLMTVMKDN